MKKEIANYEILETISENGPVSVYLAIHKILNRKTLLKVHHSDDTKLIKRFEEEARIVADLDHPSIVAIYDYGRASQNEFYISMEYVEGGNLNSYLENHDLTIDDKIKLCYQIGNCIKVIHQHGYIHRDLKPQNLLVDKEGFVKLTDFGISFHESLKRTTPDGKLLGTPLFMSPEQINNLPVTKQSDLYSLGVIYYQIFSESNPFDAPNFGEIFSRILSFCPEDLSKVMPETPDWFSKLTNSLIEKEAANRPESIQKVTSIFEQNIQMENGNNDSGKVIKRKFNFSYFLVPILIIFSVVFYFKQFNKIETKSDLSDSLSTLSSLQDSLKQNPVNTNNITETDSSKVNIPITENIENTPNNQIQQSEKRETKFFINTYPWCRVYLNYKLIDTTPLKDSIIVKPGKYLLGLQNSGYPSWSDSIEINKNMTNIFSYNLDSIFYKLELTVQPWGKVFIDGDYYGTTPLNKPIVLSKKNKTLLIENQYYNSYTDTLIWDGQPVISKNIILNEKIKN
ncbi:MAG: serine/threonine protein kinase [Calditrichaeota bacterium]|nr:serine/threonine protein kinase [Calditrichota bacterium]